MIIANPIYDAVFKYLLEDLDIAREQIRKKMEIEDELERTIGVELNKKDRLIAKTIKKKELELEEKNKELAANKKAMEEKAVEKSKKAMEEKDKMIEEL